jgi:cell surface protein SprA
MGSGLDLGSGIRVGSRYSKRVGRNFTSSGTIRQQTEVFPDLTFALTGLVERVGLLKKILPAGSISSNYQKQKSTSFDVRTGRPNSEATSQSFSPLVSISSTFSRGLSGNFRYSKSIRTDRSFVGATVSQTSENSYELTTRYSFIAPRGIRFPFLKGIRLSSSLNTNLNVQYSRRTTTNPNVASRQVSADQSELSVAPALSYSFSTQVDGGLTVNWRENTDHIAKRSTKIRSAQFWVDLKF